MTIAGKRKARLDKRRVEDTHRSRERESRKREAETSHHMMKEIHIFRVEKGQWNNDFTIHHTSQNTEETMKKPPTYTVVQLESSNIKSSS